MLPLPPTPTTYSRPLPQRQIGYVTPAVGGPPQLYSQPLHRVAHVTQQVQQVPVEQLPTNPAVYQAHQHGLLKRVADQPPARVAHVTASPLVAPRTLAQPVCSRPTQVISSTTAYVTPTQCYRAVHPVISTPLVVYRDLHPATSKWPTSPVGTPVVQHRVFTHTSPVMSSRLIVTSPEPRYRFVPGRQNLVGMHHTGCATVEPSSHYRGGLFSPSVVVRNVVTSLTRSQRSPVQVSRSLEGTYESVRPVTESWQAQRGAQPRQQETAEDIQRGIQKAMSNMQQFQDDDNAFFYFLQDVANGHCVPAECRRKGSFDTGHYWYKKKLQNFMRRFIENLQNVFGVDEAWAMKNPYGLADIVYDAMLQQAATDFPGLQGADVGFDAGQFWILLKATGGADVTMTRNDHIEIFRAMMVSRKQDIEDLQPSRGAHPLNDRLRRVDLQNGLYRIPFNLTEYPVPKYMEVHGKSVDEIARMIAKALTTGNHRDFYLCGLMSIEEVQISLPWLVPLDDIQLALKEIIVAGWESFTSLERGQLVYEPLAEAENDRNVSEAAPAPPSPVREEPDEGDLVSNPPSPPASRHRDLVAEGAPSLDFPTRNDGDSGGGCQVRLDESPPSRAALNASLGALTPDEPTPEPEPLQRAASIEQVYFNPPVRICNWNTSKSEHSRVTEADQGAGSPQPEPPQIEPASQTFGAANLNVSVEDDLFHGIALRLHPECIGPFLRNALVRCCEIYNGRHSR
eukprot:TRINITY_DN11599_c0_g1_i1.p1 TRINITY_DN11599_c0_g1~~TRINITY_DN11599_c0_g1_i1.p1  ORF type:complete len:750 (-),score=97.73 TRINITY_DN11599_c0_g1_i1:94-2307(-)